MFTLKSFYKSKEWEDFRNLIINQRLNENGESIDEITGKPIYKRYDTIIHHIEELTEANVNDYSISLNPKNVQVVSFKTHNEIHRRFGHEFKSKVFIVYGASCSGKTTFVKSIASGNDLILDMDNIWECISINERYTKPDRLKSCVFKIRDCIIDMIATRQGKFENAYVIGTYPLQTERQRLSDRLGAELIFIDTDKSTCMLRARERGGKYPQYVEEWFERYTK